MDNQSDLICPPASIPSADKVDSVSGIENRTSTPTAQASIAPTTAATAQPDTAVTPAQPNARNEGQEQEEQVQQQAGQNQLPALENIIKVEIQTSESEDDDDEMDDEDEEGEEGQNEGNVDKSKQNPENLNQSLIPSNVPTNLKPGDDPNLRFLCRCGKQYSRNASLFNHIRIKHQNNIQEYKIFDGMRKQGRPRKEFPPASAAPGAGAMQQSFEFSQYPPQNFGGDPYKFHQRQPIVDPKFQEAQKYMTNGKLFEGMKSQIAESNAAIQNGTAIHANQLDQSLLLPQFNSHESRGQIPMDPHNSFLQHISQSYQFSRNIPQSDFGQIDPRLQSTSQQLPLIYSQSKENSDSFNRMNISMDIIVSFKDFLLDNLEEKLSEEEVKQHLITAFRFQISLFSTHKVDFELHRQSFESLYTFIAFWIKYIKRDKIDHLCQEYLKFQFSKITLTKIELSPEMMKLTGIYETYQQKQKQAIFAETLQQAAASAYAQPPNSFKQQPARFDNPYNHSQYLPHHTDDYTLPYQQQQQQQQQQSQYQSQQQLLQQQQPYFPPYYQQPNASHPARQPQHPYHPYNPLSLQSSHSQYPPKPYASGQQQYNYGHPNYPPHHPSAIQRDIPPQYAHQYPPYHHPSLIPPFDGNHAPAPATSSRKSGNENKGQNNSALKKQQSDVPAIAAITTSPQNEKVAKSNKPSDQSQENQ